MRVTFTGPYRAWRDGVQLGPWAAGDEVELEPELVEFIGRDAPGCMAPPDAVQAEEPTEEPTEERDAPAPNDRMARRGRTRGA